MSSAPRTPADRKPVTLSKLTEMRALGEPIVMVTAYDHPSAVVVEEAGVDVALVDPDSFQPIDTVNGRVLVAVAARLGEIRLIDNALIETT